MPSTQLRQQVLGQARRVVVKIGTQLIVQRDSDGTRIDTAFIQSVADQVAQLRQQGVEVTVVSSGAIGCGCVELNLAKRPSDVSDQQAVAAVGQRRLMGHMHEAFGKHSLGVGQVLLSRDDFDDRPRFLNIRNCLSKLHELGCIPILNENDTVAVEEIRFGDNDMLAALTGSALGADAVILLSVVDGVLDDSGAVVDMVENVAESRTLAKDGTSAWGTGGMGSKMESARIVTDAGRVAVIANGREKDVLLRLLRGEKVGTIFVPAQKKLGARQRWIGLTARPAGTVTVDDGATRALTERGKSLLASGITQVTGTFERGDILVVRDPRGRELGRGLSNYADTELRQIIGKRSTQFAKILGRPAYAEVIHRDNLVIV